MRYLRLLASFYKSSIATELERELFNLGKQAYVLDGDNIRHGLCSDLAFAPQDRRENIRRVGEVAKLFADAGLILPATLSQHLGVEATSAGWWQRS